EVLHRVGHHGVNRAEQPHGEGPGAHLEAQLPRNPRARELANDEGREEVGDEVLLIEAAHRCVARHRRPEGEHDQRHGGGQDPDQHLGSIGDHLGEADAEEGRQGADRAPEAHAASSTSPRAARLWANSSLITSSSGAFSTVRSCTGSVVRAREMAPFTASWATWRTTPAASVETTRPTASSVARSTGPSSR